MQRYPLTLLLLFFLAGVQTRAAIGAADPVDAEIHSAIEILRQSLQAPDPTAWVYRYTEDAVFVGPGEPPVAGRAALLEMARTMTRLSAVKLSIQRTEHSGPLAYVYAHGSWETKSASGLHTSRVRTLLILRKEADGNWRVAQELMHDAPTK